MSTPFRQNLFVQENVIRLLVFQYIRHIENQLYSDFYMFWRYMCVVLDILMLKCPHRYVTVSTPLRNGVRVI